MPSLDLLLSSYEHKVLQAMARELGIKGDNRNPREVASKLSKLVGTPDAVLKAVDRLGPPERDLLGLLQSTGGSAATGAIKLILLETGRVSPTPAPNKSRWTGTFWEDYYESSAQYKGKPCLEDIAARLTTLGLVFSVRASPSSPVLSFSPGPTLFIPEQVLEHLPPMPAPQARSEIQRTETITGSARLFQRDLGRYWRYVRRAGGLRLTNQGRLYKSEIKPLGAALGYDAMPKEEPARLEFLRAHLVDLGLARADSGQLAAVDRDEIWALPAAERVRISLNAWLEGSAWNELGRIALATFGYNPRQMAPSGVITARPIILKHLAGLGTGWISFGALLRALALADYGFLFPRTSAKRAPAYYGQSKSGTPYFGMFNPYGITFDGITDEALGWLKVEAAFVGAVLAGPLFWMGLVDLGGRQTPEEEKQPAAYRLTSLGAWALGLGSPAEIEEEGGRVILQPDFQIVAMEPISDRVLSDLDAFAEPEGGDRALLYRLTRESVYRGQQAGWEVSRIVARLRELSGTPLPTNVQRTLDEWDAQYNRIVFRRNASLILTSSPALLDDLLADPGRAQILGRRVAPDAVLSEGDPVQVAQASRQAGWPPLVTRAGQDDGKAAVRIEADGAIHHLYPSPPLGARQRLALLSQEGKITAEAVQSAIRSGKSVPDILHDLEYVNDRPLPDELVARIKAWGGYFGSASLAPTFLLQARDQNILAELCADPEIGPLLRPLAGSHQALALVEPEHADKVRELLLKRGVRL